MIECPNCKSAKWTQLYRSPVNPAEDKFQCVECGHEFNRYGDRDHRLAKWGERYGISLDEVVALRTLLRGYKRRQEHVRNGDPYPGVDKDDKNACSKAWEKESEETARILIRTVKRLGFDGMNFGVGLYPALVKGDDSCIMVP